MSVAFSVVAKQVAQRLGALRGNSTAEVESSYIASPLTKAEFRDDTPYNFGAIFDAAVNAEEQLANAIAFSADHPWRAYLLSTTSSLANNAVLPSLSSASKPIIGDWGAVTDASDGIVLKRQPLSIIQLRVRNAGSQFKAPAYLYAFDGDRIVHTRTNVIIQCCQYSRVADPTSASTVLPDSLEAALVDGAVSLLKQDEKAAADRFKAVIAALQGGKQP